MEEDSKKERFIQSIVCPICKAEISIEWEKVSGVAVKEDHGIINL